MSQMIFEETAPRWLYKKHGCSGTVMAGVQEEQRESVKVWRSKIDIVNRCGYS